MIARELEHDPEKWVEVIQPEQITPQGIADA
jgi:hypothetical protein